MRNGLCRLLSWRTRRTFHSGPGNVNGRNLEGSNWKAALKEELLTEVAEERDSVCIYRVPINVRDVEPKAYSPRIISIGPYHHGGERLQEMEQLKGKFIRRIFDSSQPIDPVINALEELEEEARSCYSSDIQCSREDFVKMMLYDGCFIVGFFRELAQHDFRYSPSVQRWKLPTLRRDMIMLENQLPLFVLLKLSELTKKPEESNQSLREQALHFFNPLLQRDSSLQFINKEATGEKHFLDLFRSSVLPRYPSRVANATAGEGNEEAIHMIRSITELKKAGIIIEKTTSCPPLDVQSEGRVLKIPSLYIDDYKGTLFRNMVAYEQCHRECRPDVTSYLFFFDALINSANDIELLRHKDVMNHSLGNNRELAGLVNSLCKEIARDEYKSYLHKVESDVSNFYNTYYAKIRAKLVHHYFSSWVVGISTVAAIMVLYLTLIQTGCAVREDATRSAEEVKVIDYAMHSLGIPWLGPLFRLEDADDEKEAAKVKAFLQDISEDWFHVC